jgi:hypothetical protein
MTVAALLLPLSALADSHQKPGLWQIDNQMQMKNPQMAAAAGKMQQMTPEMQQMMAARGIKMPQVSSDGTMTQSMSNQICVTPEQAAKADHPDFGRNQQCQMTKSSYSGNTFSGEMTCHSPEMNGTGQINMTMDGDTGYHGTMHFTGTSAHGGPMDMNNQISGKWLSADCGSVKTAQQMGSDAAARAEAMKQQMQQMQQQLGTTPH